MVLGPFADFLRWAKQRMRAYRDIAPLAGLAYAWWLRQKSRQALREGKLMQLCTFLYVDVDGLRHDYPHLTMGKVSLQTLFSRTLQSLVFHNAEMANLVREAAARTTENEPILRFYSSGWLVMASINAHVLETCGSVGHVAAMTGNEVDMTEVIFALVNDRTTTSRQQLRVYMVQERQLRALPAESELDLRRDSRSSAYRILQKMAAQYQAPSEELIRRIGDMGTTAGLPSGMGRTWLCYPRHFAAEHSGEQPHPRRMMPASTAVLSAL